jgi:iron complex outermembrane receptor protein
LIQDQGAVNLDDVVQDVSGVTQSSMDNNGFNNNYVVRGLAVSYYRDGIPDGPTQNGFQRTLTDIQEVEVLKGPGSALFGSGAPGGTFNLISKQPLTVPEYRFTSTFGSFDTYREFLDVTGPLTNQLDYRFIGNYETTSGFRGVGGEMEEVLPSIIWRPADNQVVTVHFDYRNMRVTPDDVGIPFVGPELLKVPETNTYYSPFAFGDTTIFQGVITHEWVLSDFLTLRQSFSVVHRELDFGRDNGTSTLVGDLLEGRSFRVQDDRANDIDYDLDGVWRFDTGPFQHVLDSGFEYHRSLITTDRTQAALPALNAFDPDPGSISLGTLNFIPQFNRDIDASQVSAYFQDQIVITKQFQIRFGGRFDHFDISDDGVHSAGAGPVNDSQEDNRFSGQVGAVYSPFKELSFYGWRPTRTRSDSGD